MLLPAPDWGSSHPLSAMPPREFPGRTKNELFPITSWEMNIMHLVKARFWEPQVPRKRRWQAGKHLGSSGTGATAAHPTAKSPLENTWFWERLWEWEASKELARPEQSCQRCTVSTWDCAASTVSELALLPKAHENGQGASCRWLESRWSLSPHGRAVWADAARCCRAQRQGHGTGTFPCSFTLLHRFQCRCTNRKTLPQLSIISFAQRTTCFAEK